MKTLIIDNYDSFTYNLYQYLGELGGDPVVYRNDEITLEEIEKMDPSHIVISPGPGHPANDKDFGVCRAVIKELASRKPILGVCLGHQGIALLHGGEVVQAPEIMHGKVSEVKRLDVEELPYPNILAGLPEEFGAMRYHSLMAEKESFPKDLKVTAETSGDQLIMALQHEKYPLYGIQFHPESIGTEVGKTILKSFLDV
ncbi:aminodeoxychorismate/anthranilate synthase component II [Candidatus Peregrinibacteria bacterium]|jgi:anthranilate synthase component II|nr:aminodeoxychorismate/anthranilate synthase component II [Candidatus Peregrinibacteria bacterium]MBT7484106.1 aminodeoxychorismate/anthranilate synthase component II [Candidatus Peregrinibacteria bacterium]MBT7703255.1 aminodeoxychorismate/anthranilate synthase component II [Candidatus Peregrinibacteria bacterium]